MKTSTLLMTVGLITGIAAAFSIFAGVPSAIVMGWAGGALFGKGYRIWEAK